METFAYTYAWQIIHTKQDHLIIIGIAVFVLPDEITLHSKQKQKQTKTYNVTTLNVTLAAPLWVKTCTLCVQMCKFAP